MKHIIEIDGVTLDFGLKKVFQNVYIKNEVGTITGIFGRNGSGKSCLMKIIYGELSVNNKSIRINGKVLVNKKRKPEEILYLPQFHFIPKSLTIKRIFKDFGIDFSDFVKEFSEFDKYYSTQLKRLSSGEQRIIEIYIILVSKTKFCMLDEPFSQIMPIHIEIIKNIIIKESKNKGIIITDHLYSHVIDISDDIYLLRNGSSIHIQEIQELETYGYIKS